MAWYESVIRKLKDSNSSDHEAILAQVTLDDHLPAQEPVNEITVQRASASEDRGLSPAAVGSLKQGPSGNSCI